MVENLDVSVEFVSLKCSEVDNPDDWTGTGRGSSLDWTDLKDIESIFASSLKEPMEPWKLEAVLKFCELVVLMEIGIAALSWTLFKGLFCEVLDVEVENDLTLWLWSLPLCGVKLANLLGPEMCTRSSSNSECPSSDWLNELKKKKPSGL